MLVVVIDAVDSLITTKYSSAFRNVIKLALVCTFDFVAVIFRRGLSSLNNIKYV